MKIDQLTVQNYKAFKEEAVFSIKPLTLVFGENNAGKSSLVRLIPSVAKSCNSRRRVAFTPVSLSEEHVSNQDFLHGRSGSNRLYLSCTYNNDENVTISVRYEITFIPEWNSSLISSISFSANGAIVVEYLWEPSSLETDPSLKSHLYIRKGISTETGSSESSPLTFQGLKPIGPWENFSRADKVLFTTLNERWNELLRAVHWLGPLRHTPSRLERISFQGVDMTQTGKEASQILADSYKRKTALFSRVSEWFEIVLKHRLRIIEGGFDGDDLFSLALSPMNAPNIRIPFSDAGTGMSQVLPIVVLGEQAALGELGDSPVLVFENPELHLHDSIHDDLGAFFIRVAGSDFKPKIIVETHSENILLALQIAIAKGDCGISNEDVVINCVRKLSDGASIVEKVTFDKSARPSDPWPTRAFSTAPDQARQLYAARIAGSAEEK
jgi:hypothetical protein